MGNSISISQLNYEDIQLAIKNSSQFLIINTLHPTEQSCLIMNTLPWNEEEIILNNKMKDDKKEKIIIYGKNCNDTKIFEKYSQCTSLGFQVFLYKGGLFEWLMLQDIYGKEEFPTIGKEIDFLKYKPKSFFQTKYLSDS